MTTELVTQNSKQALQKKSSAKAASPIKKLSPDAVKTLDKLNEQANRKPYGRKVRDGEIIALALTLVTQDHIKTLQSKTISPKERIERAYGEFQKKHGKISYEAFAEKVESLLAHGEMDTGQSKTLETGE